MTIALSRCLPLAAIILFATVIRAADPVALPDQSLTTEAYMKLGIPSPERRWTAKDYAKAIPILQQLAKAAPSQLPRYQSKSSGAVFDRVVSPANFAPDPA